LRKTPILFAENCRKSPKIVIITSTHVLIRSVAGDPTGRHSVYPDPSPHTFWSNLESSAFAKPVLSPQPSYLFQPKPVLLSEDRMQVSWKLAFHYFRRCIQRLFKMVARARLWSKPGILLFFAYFLITTADPQRPSFETLKNI
jgi:hypothetical protein